MTRNYSFVFYLFWEQHVTVGVVGGSDLVKITEQLGKTGDEHRHSSLDLLGVSCSVTLRDPVIALMMMMMNSATLEVIGFAFFFSFRFCSYY